MSRSYKKTPIVKMQGILKDTYWKSIRRSTKNVMNSVDLEQLEEKLPNPKTIINDYDYVDYKDVTSNPKDLRK